MNFYRPEIIYISMLFAFVLLFLAVLIEISINLAKL